MKVAKNLSELFLPSSLMATLFFLLFVGQAVIATKAQTPWQGAVTAEIHGSPATAVWPFVADFCNIYKIFPLVVSFCTEGVPGRTGQIRYTATKVASPLDGNVTFVRWEKHNLTAIDPINLTLSFDAIENNAGVETFRTNMTVLPTEYGSQFIWEYIIDSFAGFTSEQFHAFLESILQRAAVKIENTNIDRGSPIFMYNKDKKTDGHGLSSIVPGEFGLDVLGDSPI